MSGSLIFFVVIAAGLALFLAMRWRQAIRAGGLEDGGWSSFAAEHQLSWQPGDLVVPSRLAGDWKGYALSIAYVPETNLLSVEVETHTVLAKGLLLTKERGAKALEKFVGFQDIQVGLPALDDLLLIQGLDEPHIQRLLRSERVPGALGRLFSRHDRARVERDRLGIHQGGVTAPPADLASWIDSLTEAAEALDTASRTLLRSDAVDTAIHRDTLESAPTEEAEDKVIFVPDEPSSEVLDLATEGLQPPPAQIIREPVRTEDIVPLADTQEERPAPLESTEDRPRTLTESAIADLQWDEEPPGQVVVGEDTSTLDVLEGPIVVSPLDALLGLLHDRGRSDKERQDALAEAGPMDLEIQISSVSRSSGRLPERLRRGRTVQASLPGDALKRLVLRFPPERNEELDALRFGSTLRARGTPSGFDDFTRQLTLDMD
jgi:hypothetical protein